MNENNNKKAVEIPPFFYNKNIVNIGIDNAGSVVSLDFNKYPHLLIGGATGAGKSTILKTIICGLLKKSEAAPAFTSFVFIDLKKVELSTFESIPGAYFKTEFSEAEKILKNVVLVINKRFEDLKEKGFTSTKESPHLFSEVFIIIDEFAELILQDKKIEKVITRIAQLGRAAGVHLILCTQLPTAKVITNLINVNMSAKIALRVETWQNSRAILEIKGAEKLPGVGDAILKQGINYTRFKAFKTSPEDIKKVVFEFSEAAKGLKARKEEKLSTIWQKLKAWVFG